MDSGGMAHHYRGHYQRLVLPPHQVGWWDPQWTSTMKWQEQLLRGGKEASPWGQGQVRSARQTNLSQMQAGRNAREQTRTRAWWVLPLTFLGGTHFL